MARLDGRSLPLSTTSDYAAERYRDAVDLLLSARPGAAEAFEEAIAADRDLAPAHAAPACLHAIRVEPDGAHALLDRCLHRRSSPRDTRWLNSLAA